jgi:peptidoglycan/xylan/chitin deacetylase (PgdA/CDA1 family)
MPDSRRLPILMYHRFSDFHRDRWTVTREMFEWQLKHLRDQGYRSTRFSELLRNDVPDDEQRQVIITIDDGYASVAEIALPLLERFGFSATCFLPVGFIGADNGWDGGGTPLMSVETLRRLPATHIELGLHSWGHEDYRRKSPEDIACDVLACRERLDELKIPYVPILAYPFGRFARNGCDFEKWRRALNGAGVRMACRIGNRLNSLPPSDPLLLTRTNIRGDEGRLKFRVKLVLGRSRLI